MLKKIFTPFFSKEEEFAIKTVVRGETAIHLPVYKPAGFNTGYTQIVKIYDKYIPLDIEKPGGMSKEECIQHINEFKQQLQEERKNSRVEVTIEKV